MATTLPPDFMTRLKSLILPHVLTVEDRDNLLTEAFYLADQRLYQQIKREGSPKAFCIHCIKTLIDFGCVDDSTHSLTLLLNTIRAQSGVDKHHEIDQVIPVLNALCATPQAKPELRRHLLHRTVYRYRRCIPRLSSAHQRCLSAIHTRMLSSLSV